MRVCMAGDAITYKVVVARSSIDRIVYGHAVD
jgi:hypothetical protein